MKRKAEYIEGQKAIENFKRGMQTLFQVSKKARKAAKKKATSRKTSGKNKG